MTKWKYKMLVFEHLIVPMDLILADLNDVGKKGWELVSMTVVKLSKEEVMIATLKRPDLS